LWQGKGIEMRLVFCSDPFDIKRPDAVYGDEVAAAKTLGIETALIHFEALVHEDDPERAVQRVPPASNPETGFYRGWMLTPGKYRQLYEALASRGVRLINDPVAYIHCHYLPESYSLIEAHTPPTVWMKTGPEVSIDAVMKLLQPFGSRPVIVKDFVKSRKHEWNEACYIPSAADRPAVERVVRRFLELQGEDLNEGLVFREFVEFEPLSLHSRSGMPLTREFRLFFLDGKLMSQMEYWEEGDYSGDVPPVEQFLDVGKAVKSRFFTMDVAKRVDGDWMIVELGDAQVAGLPETADVLDFYTKLRDRLRQQ
jgi:hypothetical protein